MIVFEKGKNWIALSLAYLHCISYNSEMIVKVQVVDAEDLPSLVVVAVFVKIH